RRRRMEPARVQYGAWDDPCVSLFATVPQEPLADMLNRLKRLPPTQARAGAGSRERGREVDACPLLLATSASTNRLYREVKHQVAQIADDRNRNYHPAQERERLSGLISRKMADQQRREFAEAMRRKQLHTNSQRLRDLKIEIDRAKTTLSVVGKRNENIAMHGSERVHERQEALEHREQVQQEKLAEQLALQQKAHQYSQQLVQQIRELQSQRERQQQADREEGRQKRHRDELAYATHLQQALEWRHERRKELKQMLDEFAALQRNLRDAEQAKQQQQQQLDVIVMEALGPVTSDFLRNELQRRVDDIERRRLISDKLGQQLSELRRKQDAHDNMLADILACERQAREKKRAHQDIEKRHMQKQQVARDLIGQREEQRLYQEQQEALYKTLPSDATSFMQRQYQQEKAREQASRQRNMDSYKGIAIGILENVQHRATAVEEDRLIRQALHDMEVDMERRVDEERMRVLHAQPDEIIHEVRPCKLSHEERQAFDLAG
ncbi:hypothetical protein KR222_003088, partial [Zaprionus bogoriensis]